MRTRRETFGVALAFSAAQLRSGGCWHQRSEGGDAHCPARASATFGHNLSAGFILGRERSDENSRFAPVFMGQQPELKQNLRATRHEKEHS
jgi:hypothetical protein